MCDERKLDPPRKAVTGVFTQLYQAGKLSLEDANLALEELGCDLIQRLWNVQIRTPNQVIVLEVPNFPADSAEGAIEGVKEALRCKAVVKHVTYEFSVQVDDDVVEDMWDDYDEEEIDEMGDRLIDILEYRAEEEGL